MRLAIIGNSQSVRLRKALTTNPDLLPASWDVTFIVSAGATGPYLAATNGMIEPRFPPHCRPKNALEVPLSTYDAIVVSALGYIDGGFKFENSIHSMGALVPFGPTEACTAMAPVSLACFRHVVEGALSRFHGGLFLRQLRNEYTGPILVQPFPNLSADIRSHPDWKLRDMYRDPEGMHAFLADAANKWLSAIGRDCRADILPLPEEAVIDGAYTRPDFIVADDLYHANAAYGALVLQQIAGRFSGSAWDRAERTGDAEGCDESEGVGFRK